MFFGSFSLSKIKFGGKSTLQVESSCEILPWSAKGDECATQKLELTVYAILPVLQRLGDAYVAYAVFSC